MVNKFFNAMVLIIISIFLLWCEAKVYCEELIIDQSVVSWFGQKGGSSVPPNIIELKEKVGGTNAVMTEAAAKGGWQGTILKLNKPVDTKKYESITFWIKQRCSNREIDCVIRLKSSVDSGAEIYRDFKAGKGEWKKVTIPLDPYSWSQGDTKSKIDMGIMDTLVWYPYSELSSPGQYIAISGVRFNPKKKDIYKIPVAEYSYFVPVNGDNNCAFLIDGQVDKATQVESKPFANNPDIVFDLGGVYLVKNIKVEAIAVPGRNISDIVISVSMDKKDWKPVDTIINNDTSGTEKRQELEKCNMNIIGRYIRLQLNRPRVDVPILLSEVSFTGKLPTAEEIKLAARLRYDIGPKMPEISEADYWILTKGKLSFAVSRKNGVICHLCDSGMVVAERIFDRYSLLTKKGILKGDGYFDTIIESGFSDGILRIVLENKQIPGLKLEKCLQIIKNRLEVEIKLVDDKSMLPAIFALSSEVVLNQNYRKGGVYENWGGSYASSLERKFASEIAFTMGVSDEAALSFEKLNSLYTLFHYRYTRNGKYAPLWWSIGSLEGNKTLYYTPTGWRMGLGLFEFGKAKQSVKSHFVISHGTLLNTYDAYQNLPLVKEFYKSIHRPEWLKQVRCKTGGASWNGIWPRNLNAGLQWYPLLLREGSYVSVLFALNFCWGEFPISGIVRNDYGLAYTAKELRNRVLEMKKKQPRLKTLFYSWLWSANASSEVFQQHHDWFIAKDKNGHENIFYPYFGKNYYRLASIQESQDDMFDHIVKMVNFYDNDGWYLDGGSARAVVDEWNFRLDEPNGWYNLQQRLRTQLQKENPDRIIFFNNCANPLGDIGFLESSILANQAWRVAATWMWKFKLYQYKDTLHYPTNIYWTPNVEGVYENYVAGLGMLPSFSSRDITPRDVAYLSAQNEIRFIGLADAKLSPDWRYNPNTKLEAIALKLGDAGLLFLRSHTKADSKEKVFVETGGLGITDKTKPIYKWLFKVCNALKWKGRLGEPELEKIYKKTGWRLERIVTPELRGTSVWQAEISDDVSLTHEQLNMLMLTQAPALIYSVDGLPTQYWLPETLGVKVAGQIKGNQVLLKIDSSRQAAEIVSIIPDGYSPVTVARNDADIPFKIFSMENRLFAVLPVVEGKQSVVIKLKKQAFPDSTPDFILSDGIPGKEMNISMHLDDDWIGKPLLLRIEKDGVMLWFTSTIVSATSFELRTLIPVAVEGGEYIAVASDSSGKNSKAIKFRLPQGKSEITFPNRYITLPVEEQIREITGLLRGRFTVEKSAKQYTLESCNVSIDPKDAQITVATTPIIESLGNFAAGGMELEAKRYIKLKIAGNFSYFQQHGHFYRGHSVFSKKANHFIGLTIDFGSESGYKVRSAASLGAINPGRKSDRPNLWGTRKKPDNIFYLSDFAYDGKNEQCVWIDLQQLGAPDDWNGMIWLTAMLQIVHPDRLMNIKILEMSDELPAEATLTEGQDLLGALKRKKVYRVPVAQGKITVDGYLNEKAWKDAVKISGLTLLNKPGCFMSQPTNCHALYDATNLYLAFEVIEKEAKSFLIRSVDRPWENDSIEFCIEKINSSDEYLHVLVDSNGGKATFIKSDKKEPTPIEYPGKMFVVKEKGRFCVELSIPLEQIGVPANDNRGRDIKFNIMRNRYSGGQTQLGTLVPGNSYFETKRFYKLKLD